MSTHRAGILGSKDHVAEAVGQDSGVTGRASMAARAFRPSRVHLGGILVSGLLGLWLAMGTDTATLGRVAGALIAIGAPVAAAVGLRLRVEVSDGQVTVRSLRGVNTYRRGEASLTVAAVLAGVVRSGRVLQFRGPQQKDDVVLRSFARAEREELIRVARDALETASP